MVHKANQLAVVVLTSVVKALFWCILIVLLVSVCQPLIVDVSPLLRLVSPSLIYIVVVAIIFAIALNMRRIGRTLSSTFDSTRLLTMALVIIGVFSTAIFSDQLIPGLTYTRNTLGFSADALLLIFLWALATKSHRPIESDQIENDSLYADNPADNSTALTITQQVVFDRIKDIMSRSSDLSIALTGNWGTGKTKIINKLKEGSNDTLWFSFYPWAYSSEEALIKDFYTKLSEEINVKLPHLTPIKGKMLTALRRLIDGSNVNIFQSLAANLFIDVASETKDPEDLIYQRLTNDKLRVIVVIDDLERVKSRAIINRTLQLVHHLRRRNIKGVSLITAFEREAVMNALPKHIANLDRSTFIEKFFDTEVILPDPLPEDLEKQLVDLLPPALKPDYVRKRLLNDLKSHRAVIRLANEYQLTDSIKATNLDLSKIVNMDDFLILAHIKLKYPFVYRDIMQNKHIYTQFNEALDDEEAITFYMMDNGKQDDYKREHIDNLIKRSTLSSEGSKVLRQLLADIFPDASKALGEIGPRSTDPDSQRRERRIGLRMVLDAALGMFDKMTITVSHEEKAAKVIKVLEDDIDQTTMNSEVKSFIEYCLSLDEETWDAPLYVLSSEIAQQDELRDQIPLLAHALVKNALELGVEYDNKIKVRILGQAFYIFTDNILYRGTPDAIKRQSVEELALVELMSFSRTPYGSLLMRRLDLSRETSEVRKYLTKSQLDQLRIMARRHFENYYVNEKHDLIEETEDLFAYINHGWLDATSMYYKGIKIHSQWLIELQRKHPGYFLDKYTTKTYRGAWAFKEEDFGTIKPVQHITDEKLEEVKELIKNIEGSNFLNEDDISRIKMIQNYIPPRS